MLVSLDNRLKFLVVAILIGIFILISIFQHIAKRESNKYKRAILSPNGELYKFIKTECENEETIRNGIILSMSDFGTFHDIVDYYITNKVKDKIKNEGYGWLNLDSKYVSMYESTYPIELAVEKISGTTIITNLLYDKYIAMIYDGIHYGMQAEQEAVLYYTKYGKDAEGDDLHPAEKVEVESSDSEDKDNDHQVDYEALYQFGTIEDEK